MMANTFFLKNIKKLYKDFINKFMIITFDFKYLIKKLVFLNFNFIPYKNNLRLINKFHFDYFFKHRQVGSIYCLHKVSTTAPNLCETGFLIHISM